MNSLFYLVTLPLQRHFHKGDRLRFNLFKKMATSLKLSVCWRFAVPCLIGDNFTRIGGASLFYQQRRHKKKRSNRIPSWQVKQMESQTEMGLTFQNEEFLEKVIHRQYENVLKSPLKEEPWERGMWTKEPRTLRTGVLALKLGIIPQWTKDGTKIYTTLLQVLDNHVISYKSPREAARLVSMPPYHSNKYGVAVVGALGSDPRQFTPEYNALFEKTGLPPKKKLGRFYVTPNAAIQPGTPLTCMHFRVGDYVDVQAKTIDRGFQGVIKRWGMKGLPASHGVTKAHRRMGSIGGRPNRAAFKKGKKMPGHMGNDMVMLVGLKIWRINTKYNILYVSGPNVPGPIHGFVRVMDTGLHYKMNVANPPPMPTCYAEDLPEEISEDLFDEDLFQFSLPSITYSESDK